MDQPEDVQIILCHGRVRKFHSSVLASNSTLFAEYLTEANAAKLAPRAKAKGVTVRWIVELRQLPCDAYPAGRLELLELNTLGEPVDPHPMMVPNDNGRDRIKTFDHYDSVLNAFSGGDVYIEDHDIAVALEDAIDIIQIAEYLGCVPVVSKPVDVALVKQGQVLFRSISAHPWSWVSMAHRIQSEMIYKEAIIHLAGSWNGVPEEHKERLDPWAKDVALKHHAKLNEKRKMLEFTLASVYPGNMSAPCSELPIRREEYAKDILVWMALSFFRHWFAQRIIDKKGALAPDGGYNLYKTLSKAGEAYMDKAIINQFHVKFPMTKKAMNVLENHLLEIKECLKSVVEKSEILNSKCLLDVGRHEVGYLTCVEVDKSDIPWFNGYFSGGFTAADAAKEIYGIMDLPIGQPRP